MTAAKQTPATTSRPPAAAITMSIVVLLIGATSIFVSLAYTGFFRGFLLGAGIALLVAAGLIFGMAIGKSKTALANGPAWLPSRDGDQR